MRIIALPVVLFSSLFAAELTADTTPQQPPARAEQQLRARVDAFSKLLVSEKYREAEQFVLPGSRNAYYTAEKPRLLDFEIKKIDWEDHFQAATVEMASNVTMRRATIGSFEVKTAYYSHWKLVKGKWLFYYPHVLERQTPFGVMKVNPDLARESGMNFDEELAKGRAELAAARLKTFAADRVSVSLPEKDSSETIILSNLLPGPIRLGFQRTSGSGFDVVLKAIELGPKATAELKIYRSSLNKAGFKPGSVVVRAYPTGQTMAIAVN